MHPIGSSPCTGRMTKPKPKPSILQPAKAIARDKQLPSDIDLQRRLRRDLRLSSADIAELDIELAIEAGLLTPPSGRT